VRVLAQYDGPFEGQVPRIRADSEVVGWKSWQERHFYPDIAQTTFTEERYLWLGTFTPPPKRCEYCGETFVWQKVELPRPVPEGARDLGLVDEWVRVVCPECGASLWLSKVVRDSFDWYLCGRCRRPVFPGDKVWFVTTSRDLHGGLGESRYH